MCYIYEYISRHLKWMPIFDITFISVFINIFLSALLLTDQFGSVQCRGIFLCYTLLDTEDTKSERHAPHPQGAHRLSFSRVQIGGGRQVNTSPQYHMTKSRTVACKDMVLWGWRKETLGPACSGRSRGGESNKDSWER